MVLFQSPPRSGISSAETRFVEKNQLGLQIVPASCPSNPHSARECSPIYSQPYYQGYYQASYPPGGYSQASYTGGYSQASYIRGYTQSYYQNYYQTSYGTCSAQNFCSGNNLYHRDGNCVDTLIEACQYGCSGSVCNGIPQPAITLQVTPQLVSAGSRVRITWTSINVTTCSLTENNPNINDTWTTLNDSKQSSAITEQTVYTLSCVGLDGSRPSISKIVNVIPIWQEK